MTPKLLVIGLDAATPSRVEPWAEQGLLPTIQKLRTSGTWVPLRNAPAVYTGSVWPSLWSGRSPGNHGCYYNEQLKVGSYGIEDFLGDAIPAEPFWRELCRAGKRVCLFDLPKTPLDPSINGIQIIDWGTHDADFEPASWPPELINDLHRRHWEPGFRRCDWVMEKPDPEAELLEQLRLRLATKATICEELLGHEPWDLFYVVFGESHCIGHQCWHVHDPSHPRHDPGLRTQLGDPLLKVYQDLDAAIGRLLHHVGMDTTVVVLGSHGMDAHHDATHLLDDILLALEGEQATQGRRWMERAQKMWKTLPLAVTESFGPVARHVRRLPEAGDRRRRRCFAVPTNANSGGIRLNLKGREPDGRLTPGPEAEAFVAELITELHELREVRSGRPLVKEVLRREEHFPGVEAERLPDLFVRWHRDEPIHGAVSPRFSQIKRQDLSTRRSGDHRPGGWMVIRGEQVPGSRIAAAVSDEDVAPTLAAMLGVQLSQVEGRAISLQ